MTTEQQNLHHDFSVTTYVVTFIILAVLTVGTVAISFLSLSPDWHFTLGLAVALVKATMVLLVFMHVWHAGTHTRMAIGAALLWLFILVSLTLTDYLSRGNVPRMPGH